MRTVTKQYNYKLWKELSYDEKYYAIDVLSKNNDILSEIGQHAYDILYNDIENLNHNYDFTITPSNIGTTGNLAYCDIIQYKGNEFTSINLNNDYILRIYKYINPTNIYNLNLKDIKYELTIINNKISQQEYNTFINSEEFVETMQEIYDDLNEKYKLFMKEVQRIYALYVGRSDIYQPEAYDMIYQNDNNTEFIFDENGNFVDIESN